MLSLSNGYPMSCDAQIGSGKGSGVIWRAIKTVRLGRPISLDQGRLFCLIPQ
jgi:hypothetical protein